MSRYYFASESHGVGVEVDLSSQVLALEAEDPRRSWRVRPLPHLGPTLPGLQAHWTWTPAMAFVLKAKAFDDGLYAAVELLAQEGTPRLPGKRELLRGLHQVLRPHWRPEATDPLKSALVLIQSALSMTEAVEESERKLRLLTMQAVKDFESQEGASKPLGFYSWSPRLQGVFKQDRMLQGELSRDVAEALLGALQSDERLMTAWRKHLRLPARLTNPLAKPALDEEGLYRCFLPPSDSHEGRLVKKLFAVKAPPEGFQLVDELIKWLRLGRLDSTPTPESGWYDHQFHALVPFVVPEKMPEAARVRFGRHYRAELEAQFRAGFALTRETHIKQLETPAAGAGGPPPIIIEPRLSIEPLAEFYRRRADAYRFVREVLGEHLGEEALADARRVLPGGVSEEPLLDELVWMEQLFRGAHAIVRQELGFGEPGAGLLPAAGLTRRWLRQWTKDADMSRDPRCVVPLFFDAERQKMKVLAVLGFQPAIVQAMFERQPQVTLHGARGDIGAHDIDFGASQYLTVCPVSAELYVSRVPDRAEFQALCAEQGTTQAILEALQR
ncbi:hypothetical protein HPC49_13370 [Pyxidicoccus fallax]|uniref:Uncharacterized protein n=1 Tax=Pyxidicoccus fallax TaxID=394095 RepID=A0A848LAW2_9BACT|nr:hypothetical protein [Pyxidicoccus fallax]NMO15382.1 hypothetical protein [Pyxidicoccus fallax]NPC79224.1 hypothetical protein [Pyxidicoccus fallax]